MLGRLHLTEYAKFHNNGTLMYKNRQALSSLTVSAVVVDGSSSWLPSDPVAAFSSSLHAAATAVRTAYAGKYAPKLRGCLSAAPVSNTDL